MEDKTNLYASDVERKNSQHNLRASESFVQRSFRFCLSFQNLGGRESRFSCDAGGWNFSRLEKNGVKILHCLAEKGKTSNANFSYIGTQGCLAFYLGKNVFFCLLFLQ